LSIADFIEAAAGRGGACQPVPMRIAAAEKCEPKTENWLKKKAAFIRDEGSMRKQNRD
jgi:hypothetical protein